MPGTKCELRNSRLWAKSSGERICFDYNIPKSCILSGPQHVPHKCSICLGAKHSTQKCPTLSGERRHQPFGCQLRVFIGGSRFARSLPHAPFTHHTWFPHSTQSPPSYPHVHSPQPLQTQIRGGNCPRKGQQRGSCWPNLRSFHYRAGPRVLWGALPHLPAVACTQTCASWHQLVHG